MMLFSRPNCVAEVSDEPRVSKIAAHYASIYHFLQGLHGDAPDSLGRGLGLKPLLFSSEWIDALPFLLSRLLLQLQVHEVPELEGIAAFELLPCQCNVTFNDFFHLRRLQLQLLCDRAVCRGC